MAGYRARGKGKDRRWYARVRVPTGRVVDGKPERKQVERGPFDLKGEAERWAKGVEGRIVSGEFQPGELDRGPAPAAGTFADAAHRYLASATHLRPSSRKVTETRLRVHVTPVLGELPVDQITRSHVRALVAGLVESGKAARTVRVIVAALSQVMQMCVEDEQITTNPTTRIRLPAIDRRREFIPAETVAQIIASVPDDLRTLFIVAAATGMRSGEVRGLTADKISPAVHLAEVFALPTAGSIDVTASLSPDGRTIGPTKSKSRTIAVPADVIGVIRDHVQTHGLTHGHIFGRDGSPVTQHHVTDAWKTATKGLNLPPRSGIHDLRHFAISTWLSEGIPIAQVAKMAGHANPTTTLSTYAHALVADEQRAIDVSDRLLKSII